MNKGELVIDIISRITENDKPVMMLTGVVKPQVGAEQRIEFRVSEENWEKIGKHIAWENVVKAMETIRAGMNQPARPKSQFVCPACGQPREGHELPDAQIVRESHAKQA